MRKIKKRGEKMTEDYRKIDKELEKMLNEGYEQVPGLGVIVYKNNEEVYSKFIGERNIRKKLPMTRETRLRVASVSKMFTIFTIMELIECGKINLDEDASKYLGFELRNPNFAGEKITIRMLASHTSTLRDGEKYNFPLEKTLKESLNEEHFGKEDKKYFKYCNLNYGILGTIIENVTGKRFDIYQKENILKKLEIKGDYVVGNLEKKEYEKLGALYQQKISGKWQMRIDDYEKQPGREKILINDEEKALKKYKIGSNATIFSPAGGLRISFEEMAHALEMIMNSGQYKGKEILKRESLEQMMTPQWIYNGKNGENYGVMNKYGLGMYKIDGNSSARLCKNHEIDLIGHSGEAYGMISGLYFVPGTKDGVIFMINGEAIEPEGDKRSHGKFSEGYIWEENIMNPICEKILLGSVE